MKKSAKGMLSRKGGEYMWMVKRRALAPYYGIARTRGAWNHKALPADARLVRVIVKELINSEIAARYERGANG